MKVEFEKQFGKGVDPWYAKAERWAKKQKFPISFLALGLIAYLKKVWINVKIENTMRDVDRQVEDIKKDSTPISLSLVIAPTALFVCTVDKTRWPVKLA